MKCTNFKHILALLTYDLKSPVFEQEALKKSKMEPGHPVILVKPKNQLPGSILLKVKPCSL